MLSMSAGRASEVRERAVTPGDIIAELDRILGSVCFRRSPRLRTLLQYAVTNALNVAQLTERMVAKNQFGRNADFDPLLDPTVRVQFGRLRKRLEYYFKNEGVSDPVRIRIPERSYTPVFEPGGPQETFSTKPEEGGAKAGAGPDSDRDPPRSRTGVPSRARGHWLFSPS